MHLKISHLLKLYSCLYMFQLGACIILNKAQLSAWFPNYATDTELYLFDKNIDSIADDTFENLPNLQTLSLSYNKLTSLNNPSLFKSLTSLKRLFIENNQLATLASSSFLGLTNLVELFLNDNKLTQLDSLLFQSLRSIQRLDLSYNQLSTLNDVNIFSRLSNIRELDLEANRLVSIDGLIFVGLNNLERVYLENNPIALQLPNYVLKLCSTNLKCQIFI